MCLYLIGNRASDSVTDVLGSAKLIARAAGNMLVVLSELNFSVFCKNAKTTRKAC